MRKLVLVASTVVCMVFAAGAGATATSTYSVSSSPSRAAIVNWTTNRAGDLTMTLRYSAKGTVAFNVPVDAPCVTTTGPGFITYSCTNAPAASYSAMIWTTKGSLSGTLTVAGETD